MSVTNIAKAGLQRATGGMLPLSQRTPLLTLLTASCCSPHKIWSSYILLSIIRVFPIFITFEPGCMILTRILSSSLQVAVHLRANHNDHRRPVIFRWPPWSLSCLLLTLEADSTIRKNVVGLIRGSIDGYYPYISYPPILCRDVSVLSSEYFGRENDWQLARKWYLHHVCMFTTTN